MDSEIVVAATLQAQGGHQTTCTKMDNEMECNGGALSERGAAAFLPLEVWNSPL
jgi:hypothetical protein